MDPRHKMDPYTPLLEKLRNLRQPPLLLKHSVHSLFSLLRADPTRLHTQPARLAITQCLTSTSPAVIDQSVRELCRLVADSIMDVSTGLMELQSGLEGSDEGVQDVFVKGIGCLVRIGFKEKKWKWKGLDFETHPFVKVLSSRAEAQNELEQQVLLFMAQSKHFGMVEVCEFLRPFMNFSIIRIPFSDSSSSLFLRGLVSSLASFCCSYPDEAMPILKLLTSCLKYLPLKKVEDFRSLIYFVGCMVDAYISILRHLVEKKSVLIAEAQLYGVELLETTLAPYTNPCKHPVRSEPVIERLNYMLVFQRDLGLRYVPELSSAILSLFVILIRSELEHEQICISKVLLFLLKWKRNEEIDGRAARGLSEEHLLVFPVIGLLSSPSNAVKKVAGDLLVVLEELLVKLKTGPKHEMAKDRLFSTISRPESIIYGFLRHLWFEDQRLLPASFFLSFASSKMDTRVMQKGPSIWASCLKEYSISIVERQKSTLALSHTQENFLTEMPWLVSAIACVLLMHPASGDMALDALTSVGLLDPTLGVPLLLAILFYNNIFTKLDLVTYSFLPKLLGVLPRLASHSVMIPLVVQTILPMLNKDAKPVLYATGIRLLCQTWEINDRTFKDLQGVLLPKSFFEFASERSILLSLAACVRDVCRKNPDRGVDLILSVSACIESRDAIIQALGFQSLGYLCEADVIDFYTAWDVVAKHVLDYSSEPSLAQSICSFLRWGAMDAEAYAEAASNVLRILWDIGNSKHIDQGIRWAKARLSALEALTNYEVSFFEKVTPDFKIKIVELLFNETHPDVLVTMERFLIKVITYEHINRRRLVKEKRAASNKIEKLLDVFPQAVFSSGKRTAGDLPGAALLTLSFASRDIRQDASRGQQDVQVEYENALVEISSSLQLSRNIFIGLLSLQSWKPFVRRWMRNILSFDARGLSTVLDKTTKAASNVLKSMIRIAEDSNPRSAENIALAIGALCSVLPPAAHTVKSTASKFLLGWLYLYEHEHYQWTAAVSLGLISSCLHVTDHTQKFQNINGLLEVFSSSKSTFVRGACGVGLGFSCQDLVTRSEAAADDVFMDKERYKMQELELLGKIAGILSQTLCQLSHSTVSLKDAVANYALKTCYVDISKTTDLMPSHDLEEDVWGIAGIVLGLGNSVSALYRAGAHNVVVEIKKLILSWIPHMNSQPQDLNYSSEGPELVLSVGSCLALPTVVEFCQRVELVDANEIDNMISGFRDLISELLSMKKTGTLHQSLLMAACVGAGNLLSCILNEGIHPLEVERVQDILNIFKRCYSNPQPPLVHFSGMLGIINAMDAGAGYLFYSPHLSPSMQSAYGKKESSYVMGPLLSAPLLEPYITSLVQDIYLVAQHGDDLHLQEYASWAASILRHRLWSMENASHAEIASLKSVSQSFPEDSVVMRLSLWLMHLNYSGTGFSADMETVKIVLQCLSRAPRLPSLDWGAIIRRCMKFGAHDAWISSDSSDKKGTLREECVRLSLAHANHCDHLLTFLDELSDLPRFRTLELNLQSCLLLHLADMVKIFSGSRVERLLKDMANYLASLISCEEYDPEQKSFLRISCWKGLYLCLDEASVDSLEYISSVEECMEVLFSLLPPLQCTASTRAGQLKSEEEWSGAVECLGKARQDWLLNFLQVSQQDIAKGEVHFAEVLKRILAKVKLVRIRSIPLTEMARLKAYILNCEPVSIWAVLVEVAAVLQHAEGGVKIQWLVDAMEISCVTSYPSTALQFIALLSGSWCKYMPLLVIDRQSLLNYLPVTLPSLLLDPSWQIDVESVVSYLWASTERIHSWAIDVRNGSNGSITQPIDASENAKADFLARVVHHTCLNLKDYLPFDKQLQLSKMLEP